VTQSNYVPKTQIALNEGLSIFRLKFLSLIFRTFSKKEKHHQQVVQGESGGASMWAGHGVADVEDYAADRRNNGSASNPLGWSA
jgi:hypothetical protein